MTSHFHEERGQEGSPVKLSGLSPEKYGSTAYKNLTYTPQKLQANHIYREVTITKKVETEKNRIRELESLNLLLEDKIGHLTQENQTLAKSYDLQIEMYKRMLKENEEETRKLIKNLQSEYTLEIHKILQNHEEDSKVAQAEKEELERRIDELLMRIDDLEGHVHHGGNTASNLTSQLNMTSQKLANTQEKLAKAQELARQTADRLNKEISSLNNRILQQSTSYKQQLDSSNNDKIREIQALKRFHLTQLDKQQSRRDAEMNSKGLQMKDIKSAFEAEGRRLQEIIKNKDRVNEALGLECKRQKERIIALTRNYDMEINQLVNQKDHILADLSLINEQRSLANKQIQDMGVVLDAERGRSAALVIGLQTEIGKKNMVLAGQNDRLMRTVSQYEKELLMTNQNANAIHKSYEVQRSDEVRRLVAEIRNLKEILIESSGEMESCKQQFLRMEMERENLVRINHECSVEAIRLKAIISEQDAHLRMRRL